MKTTEIIIETLESSFRFYFDDGTAVLVTTFETPDFKEGANQGLKFTFSQGTEVILPSSVDNSQTVHNSRVFILGGIIPSRLFVFGGRICYWIDSNGIILAKQKINREQEDEEYWFTKIYPLKQKVLIEFESCLMMINESLDLVWCVKKDWTDHVHDVNEDFFFLSTDDKREIKYSVAIGKKI